MSDERWMITGALGCIGGRCCRRLVGEGHTGVAFDPSEDRHRAELIMSPAELSAVTLVRATSQTYRGSNACSTSSRSPT